MVSKKRFFVDAKRNKTKMICMTILTIWVCIPIPRRPKMKWARKKLNVYNLLKKKWTSANSNWKRKKECFGYIGAPFVHHAKVQPYTISTIYIYIRIMFNWSYIGRNFFRFRNFVFNLNHFSSHSAFSSLILLFFLLLLFHINPISFVVMI